MSWTDVIIPLAFLLVLGYMILLLGKGVQKADKARSAATKIAGYAYVSKEDAKTAISDILRDFHYRLSGVLHRFVMELDMDIGRLTPVQNARGLTLLPTTPPFRKMIPLLCGERLRLADFVVFKK